VKEKITHKLKYTKNYIMKKLLFIILVLCPFCLKGQERVNTERSRISPNILSELSVAKGYMLQKYGEWLEGDNVIPKQLGVEDKELAKYRFGGIDNFFFFQFREFNIGEREYIVLIKKSEAPSSYKYPTIKEGLSRGDKIDYAVFEKAELQNKLSEIKDGQINVINISLAYMTGVIDASSDLERDLSIISQRIVERIDNFIYNSDGAEFVMQIAPYKEKNIVQFFMYSLKDYTYFKSINFIYSSITTSEKDFSLHFGTAELFKHCHYETDYDTFSKFIKLP